jgi:hypothetical protein
MNLKTGLKIVSVVAVLAIAGCMTGQDAAPQRDSAEAANFVKAVSVSLAQITGSSNASNIQDPEAVAANLEAVGCPKLAKLFRDASKYTGQGAYPESFNEVLPCFGLTASPTQEDIDGIFEKFNDPTELLDCICGGSALSDLLSGKIELFSAATSSAAASSFSASESGAGEAFNSSSSTPGGSTYTGASSNGYSSP